MDEMKIKTKFLTGIVSKIIKKTIFKKFGYDVDFKLNDLCVAVNDGRASIQMSINAEIDNKEFMKILKDVGLD